jgi:hypothetical protein
MSRDSPNIKQMRKLFVKYRRPVLQRPSDRMRSAYNGCWRKSPRSSLQGSITQSSPRHLTTDGLSWMRYPGLKLHRSETCRCTVPALVCLYADLQLEAARLTSMNSTANRKNATYSSPRNTCTSDAALSTDGMVSIPVNCARITASTERIKTKQQNEKQARDANRRAHCRCC